MILPSLTLTLPWIPDGAVSLDGLTVGRGTRNALVFPDGITLEVKPLDPSGYPDVDALQTAVRAAEGPGRVTLVAGSVPVGWRAQLRADAVSFLDVTGVAEIRWPRMNVSAGRFTLTGQRHRKPIPLQKGHGLVAQELLIATGGGVRPSIGDIARGAHISLSAASRTITQLANQGMVSKHRVGNTVYLSVPDRVVLSMRLADRTSWPGPTTTHGYAYGQNTLDVAARISSRADAAGMRLAVTGRTGAAFLGVLGTSSSPQVRLWVSSSDSSPMAAARSLGLEPAPEDEANVAISVDRWQFGLHRARPRTLDGWTATIAHPLRVWCDLHDEPRGSDFAAQLWSRVTDD